jgi:hypothetical protein
VSRILDILLTDLRYLVADLGKDGGLIGPSIYDTAQVLRLAPPAEGVWPALNWLVRQQRADGGWGDPAVPRSRDTATLAAVLALHTYGTRARELEAVQTGLTFLRRNAVHWKSPLPDDLPVAVELILPHLLDVATARELGVGPQRYAALMPLNQKRHRQIAYIRPGAGTTPAHSWESWGTAPDLAILDGSGGVGHSPGATAAWLRTADDRADLADACAAASHYLEQAAAATRMNIPGVVPTVWPIVNFERSWGGDLRADGIGMSPHFVSDGDISAVTITLLAATGQPVDAAVLDHFVEGGTFRTYQHELQRSHSTLAHAAHAISLLRGDSASLHQQLVELRGPDGRYMDDKWNASWLYLTGHMITSLISMGATNTALASLPTVLDYQSTDGSWGDTAAVVEETAYGAQMLLALDAAGVLPQQGQAALHKAARWLFDHYRPLAVRASETCWIGKELYRPDRVAPAFEISATLACALKGYGL